MKLPRPLLIIVAVLFFITAITFYLNRVVFPRLIKQIAIERIEDATKRKVEIGSIHFNWVRGFMIDKIKVYEKGSDAVFAQADQVSFGILFFPGLKHNRLTIPFINIKSPSVHLVRKALPDIWNISDLYNQPAAAAKTSPSSKASNLEIAWGGLTVSDGKFLIEDASRPQPWSEFFDNINLKLSLSYKGISYDFTADIPGKKGLVGATVYYQPLTKDTQAHIRLKNIDTASYLAMINLPDVHLNSGTIQDINLNIHYTQEKTSVQGDVLMKDLDILSQERSFKGDVEIRGLDALYDNGNVRARGQLTLSHAQTTVPELSAGGNVQARVNEFTWSKDNASFNGSLDAQQVNVDLKDRHIALRSASLENIRVKRSKDGIQSTCSVGTKGLFVQWPDQKIQGDISVNGFTVHLTDENNIQFQGEVQAADLSSSLGSKDLSCAALKTDRLAFDLSQGMIKASTTINASKARIVLEGSKTVSASPQLELHLQLPLNDPQKMLYSGSITLSDGAIAGFPPVGSLSGIEMDVDFQNDQATINALSANVLDTNVHVTGSIKDFQHPILNVLAEANDLNLAKIKDLSPGLLEPLGLSLQGSSFVKVQFEGLASDPLSGKILAVASFKNAGAVSSKLKQHLKDITGIIEATPDSLKWRDFTAVYQGRKYSLAGTLDDFKKPHVITSIDGPGFGLQADIVKNDNHITINALKGKYLNADISAQGSVTLGGQAPALDISTKASLNLEDLVKTLPQAQAKSLQPLNPTGHIDLTADLKGAGQDWKTYQINAGLSSPVITLSGYKLNDVKITAAQDEGKIKNLVLDGKLYEGTVHGVGSLDLLAKDMPYDAALNIDGTDLHELKMDSPLKMQEINGKFYFTSLAHGTVADFKDNMQATGSLAIRDGFLAEFNLFKGLLSVLNDALRIGQVQITDVESNFTIANQKINTDNLRLKGPTIVLLGKGWVNFDQDCDLNVTVDLSSGVVPAIANDVLSTLNIRIYDKIANPKFKKKISVPQVINSLFKNLLQ